MSKSIFFSKDDASAMAHIERLAREDKFYNGKRIKKSRKQIPHISGWKTYEVI